MSEKTPEQAAEIIDTAYNSGINFIDSADIYGQGKSEEIFNAALKLSHVKCEDLFIQSKIGIVFSPERSHGSRVFGSRYEFTKDHILAAVDGILKRRDIAYLDSLLLHRPDALMDLNEVKEAFDILQRSASQKAWDFNPEMNETSWQTAT